MPMSSFENVKFAKIVDVCIVSAVFSVVRVSIASAVSCLVQQIKYYVAEIKY